MGRREVGGGEGTTKKAKILEAVQGGPKKKEGCPPNFLRMRGCKMELMMNRDLQTR